MSITGPPSGTDLSNGWEAVADQLIQGRRRTRIGEKTLRAWAATLPPGASILDLACGSGVPVSTTLAELGFHVCGLDASPALVAEFRRQLPQAPVACEAAETSRFFDRTFDAVVAIGFMFLLSGDTQRMLIARIGAALNEGGRFLFTAPHQRCEWIDMLTGRPSLSLGAFEYEALLECAGLRPHASYMDEGENNYYDALKAGRPQTA